MDASLASAKDAARSKFKSSQRHKPAGPGGRGFAARGGGRGGRSGGDVSGRERSVSRSRSPPGDPDGSNAWRYDEARLFTISPPLRPADVAALQEAEADDAFATAAAAAAAAGEPPPPRSAGADLAELLERAAQSSFLGRGGARTAFASGWGDAGDGDAAAGASAGGAAPLAALLDWQAPPLAACLAPLPLHALLGLPRRYTADCEASFARDVAAAVASSSASASPSQPLPLPQATQQLAPPAPPVQPPPMPQPAAARAAPPAAKTADAPPRAAAVAVAVAAAEADDDAFLDEMLGAG